MLFSVILCAYVLIAEFIGSYVLGVFFGTVMVIIGRFITYRVKKKNPQYSLKRDLAIAYRNFKFHLGQMFVFEGDEIDG